MKRSEMVAITADTFSRKALAQDPEDLLEWQVLGKFCKCAYLGDGKWDVWVYNAKDPVNGLSKRRIDSIKAVVASSGKDSGPFRSMDGEGVYSAMPTDVLLFSHRALGIKTKSKNKGSSSGFFKKGVAA